jgi:hypothetical protein
MSAIEDQKITFYNSIEDGKIYKTAESEDPTNSDIGFITRYRSPVAMQKIIDNLTHAINGNYNLMNDYDISNQIDIAFIEDGQINYYDQDGQEVLYSSQLVEFREVLIAWREFFLTPPLNGSPASSSDNNLIV